MKPTKNIETLIEIMQCLRDPKTGCPWDIEQNFKSIAPYTIEEAYEVADAIERGDPEDLRLELGDLLLQSVYHAQMASETGHFDFGDVVEGICNKMIRRHPHVFGTANKTAQEYSAEGLANGTWERIKAEEKAELNERRKRMGLPEKKGSTSILDDVPTNMPSTTSAFKLQSKAAKVGFDWGEIGPVYDKIREELSELENAFCDNDQLASEAEFGDLMFALINLARHKKIDPESALRKTNQKFRNRFRYIEQSLSEKGVSLEGASLEEMDHYWNEAKTLEETKF